ncbi:MAG: hypothetical protein ACOH5I_08235 [Oligoflexus sp.]
MISGRGVGLDAVRALMADIDGTVKINIGSSKGLHENFYAIAFELEFPIPDVNKDIQNKDAA